MSDSNGINLVPGIPSLRLQSNAPQLTVSYSNEDFDEDSDSEGDAALLAAQGDDLEEHRRARMHRPASPEPPLLGAERTIDPRSMDENCDENARDHWDSAVGMSGARECPVRVRAPLEEAAGWRLGVSAPELGPRPNLLDEESEGDANQARGYPGYSWRETLCRFPGLLQLYPLAAASEDPGSEAGGAIDGLEGNEEYLNGHPSSSQGLQPAASQVSPQRSANSADAQTPRSGAPEMSTAKDMQQVKSSQQPKEASGHSAPCTPCTGHPADQVHSAFSAPARIRTPQPPDDEWLADQNAWSKLDLADAWAEVEQARYSLEQRERALEMREAALRRSEARHRASLRKLSEMRRRLEDYGEELEETMAQVLAQQSLLRDERRQSSELHARARQMLDATRKNGISKRREWEKTSLMSQSP